MLFRSLLDEQRVLAAKADLSRDERRRLGELTNHLDELGFSVTEDDEVYALFRKRLTWRENQTDPTVREQIALTPEQQEDRQRMVDEIISELIAEGRL